MRNLLIFTTAVLLTVFFSCASDAYTGLVIDARGFGLMPGMSPRVFDTAGNQIYGTTQAAPDYVEEEGMARYAETVDEARTSETAGSEPLVVKAIGRSSDPCNTAVTLSAEDGQQILQANYEDYFLNNYKVVIVL